jgi:DNA replication protein DnaC
MSAPSCPFGVCDGSGFVVDEESRAAQPCRCRAQQVSRARARKLSGVIPRRYRGVSFDRPPVTSMPDAQVGAVRQYIRNLDTHLGQGSGLWFLGGTGTGKTTLAMLISSAALDAGHSVAIYSLPRLLAEIRATYTEDVDGSYLDFFDRLASVDLLQLDDLGAQRSTDWVFEQLYSLINSRYEEQRSIVVTTNIDDPRELEEQIGRRTVSRLAEMCEQVPLYGPDGRLEVRPESRHDSDDLSEARERRWA